MPGRLRTLRLDRPLHPPAAVNTSYSRWHVKQVIVVVNAAMPTSSRRKPPPRDRYGVNDERAKRSKIAGGRMPISRWYHAIVTGKV